MKQVDVGLFLYKGNICLSIGLGKGGFTRGQEKVNILLDDEEAVAIRDKFDELLKEKARP